MASPNEDMADVIVRQYDRIFQPPVKSIDITWPGKVIKQVPDKIASAFAGDTLHVFAELGSSTEEAIEVDVNYSTISINLTVLKSNVADDRLLNRIPMMYAAEQVESLSKDEATEMAVQHGLISKYTSYSLVCDDMKIEGADIPELVTIPNEVPAGWGGAGSVVRACVSNSLSVCESGSGYQVDYLDIPAFLRRQSEDQPKFRLLSRFAEKLNSYYQRRSGVDLHHDTIQDLRELKLPQDLLDELITLRDMEAASTQEYYTTFELDYDERILVVYFLYLLMEIWWEGNLSTDVRKRIKRAGKLETGELNKDLKQYLENVISDYIQKGEG